MTPPPNGHHGRIIDLLVILDRRKPLRLQLERQLRDGIRSGRLQAGIRLPASRVLACELGVSRGVVVEAYAQLTAEGYLDTCGSGGTRVAGVASRPARHPRVVQAHSLRFDLRAGLPDASLFPRRAWSAATAEAMRVLPDSALLYGSAKGQPRLRRAIVSYLGRARAIAADEGDTFITCGSSHAFALLWSALRGAGVHRVAYEDPGWERIVKTIKQAELQPVPVRVDGRGLSMSELYQANAQAVVVSPAHQYPTGVIMHPARRAELIRWARESGGLIIEDDYDAEYRFGAGSIAPLRSSSVDCVAYVGTTSKILAPALRLGWLLVPERLAQAVASEHAVSYAQPGTVNQRAFAMLLEDGEIDRHLRKARRIYKARRSALIGSIRDTLPTMRVGGGAAGLHLIGWLPPQTDEDAVVAAAARLGVAVDGLRTRCSVTTKLGPALVLGYGGIAESAIPEAISRLSQCLGGPASASGQYRSAPAAA